MAELQYATAQLTRIIEATESCYPQSAKQYRDILNEIIIGGNDQVKSILAQYQSDEEIGSNITAILRHNDSEITADLDMVSDDCLNNILAMVTGLEPLDVTEYRIQNNINSIGDVWDRLDRIEKIIYYYYRQLIEPLSKEEEQASTAILTKMAPSAELTFRQSPFSFERIDLTLRTRGTGSVIIHKLQSRNMIIGRINNEQDPTQWYGLVRLDPAMNVRVLNITNY